MKKKPLTLKEKKKKELAALKAKYSQSQDINNLEIDSDLDKNLVYINSVFDKVNDLVIKEFVIGSQNKTKAGLLYISGLVEKTVVDTSILKPLMVTSRDKNIVDPLAENDLKETIENSLLSIGEVSLIDGFDDLIDDLLAGNALLFLNGYSQALSLSIQAKETRDVVEPETETVVRGPKEGFVEDFNINLSLIRRRIKTPDLKFEAYKIGRVSNTDVIISYIEGIVEDDLITEVRKRIQNIDTDMINESGNIEQLIEDSPYSPFPQMTNTERPDGVASALNEGRVAIIIDGTPFVLVVPSVLIHFLQANEDYYERFLFPTAIRVLRVMAFAVALLGPSIYVAITTYHQEMIPTPLLISIAASRSGVPFPGLVEALLMEISFEALREAGLRLPRPVGQAVSIVGALVVGEAAVQAGLVSRAMVIVVALTGISSFIIPAYNMGAAIRLLRFPIIFLAGTLGMFGITFAILFLLIHISALRSFGVPYLSPITPIDLSGLKDSIIKVPDWLKNKRPTFLVKEDKKRIKSNSKPTVSNKQGEENE